MLRLLLAGIMAASLGGTSFASSERCLSAANMVEIGDASAFVSDASYRPYIVLPAWQEPEVLHADNRLGEDSELYANASNPTAFRMTARLVIENRQDVSVLKLETDMSFAEQTGGSTHIFGSPCRILLRVDGLPIALLGTDPAAPVHLSDNMTSQGEQDFPAESFLNQTTVRADTPNANDTANGTYARIRMNEVRVYLQDITPLLDN